VKLFELLFKEINPFPKNPKTPSGGSSFRGVTLIAKGHTHQFQMIFDHNGKITSGATLKDDTGHVHQIKKMGETEKAAGHTHKLPIPQGGGGAGGGGM